MLLDRDPSEQEADMSVRHTADKHAVRLESTPAPDCRAVANERISELMPPISDLASKHELVEKLSDRTILLTADKAGADSAQRTNGGRRGAGRDDGKRLRIS
jgi:hypothetical protein